MTVAVGHYLIQIGSEFNKSKIITFWILDFIENCESKKCRKSKTF